MKKSAEQIVAEAIDKVYELEKRVEKLEKNDKNELDLEEFKKKLQLSLSGMGIGFK